MRFVGYAICAQQDDDGRRIAVFAGTEDPDYQKILAMCVAGKNRLEPINRFDMPGSRPDPVYVREMKRYGVLGPELPLGMPINVYEIDRLYWKSLWYPAGR